MNFTYERLSDDTILHLAPLYYALYKKQLPVSYFTNKYNTTYLTERVFGYFAFHHQTAVAFVGMIPYRMQYNGNYELSLQCVDCMTHPEYMKKELFQTVMQHVYADLSNEEITFVWGFPNAGSLKSFTGKLNWLPTEPMNGYCVPVANPYWSYLKRKRDNLFYGKSAWEKKFQKEIINERPAHSLANAGFVTTVRDAEYFRYKNFGESISVELNGVKIWMKLTGSILIGDMDNISESELRQLMPLLIAKGEQCGATNIYFQTHGGSLIDNSFTSIYPKFGSWKILYHNLKSKFPLEKIRVTLGDLDSF